MKILILCNDFPPLNSIGAQRPWYWYKYLSKLGIDPVVITKNWKGHSSTREDIVRNVGDQREIIEHHDEGVIVRAPILLTPSEKMLLKYGTESHVFRRRILTVFNKIFSFVSINFDSHKSIYKAADNYLKVNKVDAILATGEPFVLFRQANLLSKKYKIPWVADYRDGWYLNYVTRQQKGILSKGLREFEKLIEKRVIKNVHSIISVDPILANALGKMHNKPFEIIYNGFESFHPALESPSANLPLILTHSGTLTTGQRAEVLLQAVRELLEECKISKDEICLKWIGLEYFPDQLKRIRSYEGIPSVCIHTTPRLNRQDVVNINQASDYLLIFSDKKFKWISAKAFEYIACKRPILLMPDDYSIMASFIKKLNAGIVLDDIETIKLFLVKAIEKKRKKSGIIQSELSETEAVRFTRYEQTKKLADYLIKHLHN